MWRVSSLPGISPYLYIMANKRITFEVDSTIAWANIQLARTDEYATQQFKDGICATVEHILHQTGNYNGYMELYPERKEIWSRKYFTRSGK